MTLIGLGLIIASACVFNNYLDRHADAKMKRTKSRALASGTISAQNALLFGLVLAIVGNGVLFYWSNLLAVTLANVGFFVYLLLYSLLKSKTQYSTLIGSVAGAIPPLVGYCAVSNELDLGAGIFFLIMVCWQMPHFYAIALWHLEDYKRAELPLLPIVKGVTRTKIEMILYILCLIPVVSLLTIYGYTGFLFLASTLIVGLGWLYLSFKGFRTDNTKKWGRQMFRLSLAMIAIICVMIPFD